MSIKIMSAIWDGGPIGATNRFVLIALADNANDDGECWPSVATISRKTGICERSVRTAIRHLETEGWLRTKIGTARAGANHYQIITTPAANAPGSKCPPAANAPPPRQQMPPPPAANAPEPSITINKPSEAKASLRETQSRFDEFWETYPHRGGAKKGRKASQAKYEAAVKRGVSEKDIIAGAERYGGDRGVIDGYAKDPATWLNGAGWQDDIETKGPMVQTQGGRNDGNSKSEQRMRAFLEGARGSSGMDRGPDIDPSRPLLARG